MSDVVIVAIIAAIGTVSSGILSAIMANRVTVYRLDALTKEVEKHNSVIERTYRLEPSQIHVVYDSVYRNDSSQLRKLHR